MGRAVVAVVGRDLQAEIGFLVEQDFPSDHRYDAIISVVFPTRVVINLAGDLLPRGQPVFQVQAVLGFGDITVIRPADLVRDTATEAPGRRSASTSARWGSTS